MIVTLRGTLEKAESIWKWTGRWAFGNLDDPSNKSLPFVYTWERPAEPDKVVVPSSIVSPDTEDNTEEEKQKANPPDQSVKAEEEEETKPKDQKQIDGGESKEKSDEKSDEKSL